MSLLSIKDKVVVITGASRGIGRALAEGFVSEGARVYGTGSRPESISWMKNTSITGIAADVQGETAMKEALADIHKKEGKIDCLVNNAGVSSTTPASAFKEDEIEKIMNTNFKGVFRACQAYYRLQRKQGGGNIINVSSILGLVGTPLASIYCGSKGAVIQLSRALAIEWAANNFRINNICPGFIDTDMTEKMKSRPQVLEDALRMIPMNRLGQPQDLLGAALFLASDASSYMTGQNIIVDGGITAI